MSKKKKEIRIIKKDSRSYTFLDDNLIDFQNKNYEDSILNNNDSNKKIHNRIDKKITSKKINDKGRKIMGRSMQGHSPVYE